MVGDVLEGTLLVSGAEDVNGASVETTGVGLCDDDEDDVV